VLEFALVKRPRAPARRAQKQGKNRANRESYRFGLETSTGRGHQAELARGRCVGRGFPSLAVLSQLSLSGPLSLSISPHSPTSSISRAPTVSFTLSSVFSHRPFCLFASLPLSLSISPSACTLPI